MTIKKDKHQKVKIGYSFMKIMTGSDLSIRRIPFLAAISENQGPVLWLTACVHGDEVSGLVVVHEVFKIIRKTLRKGSIYSFPLVNPIGFEAASRHITFSNEDLNRAFPGNKNGTLAERIADKVFTSIISTKPSLVIDIHNDWRMSIPYVLLDPKANIFHNDAYSASINYAFKTGFLVVVDSDILRMSISHNMLTNEVPSITIELGEAYLINEKNVYFGVQSILNILESLEMIERKQPAFAYEFPQIFKDKLLDSSNVPKCSTSGIIRFLVKPGQIVKKDMPVAKIYNALGRLLETLKATGDGIVLAYSDYSVAFPGANIITFALLQNQP